MTIDEALQLALEWAARGIPAFPIAISWDDRKSATHKRPLTNHGHLSALTDESSLRRLFTAAVERLKSGEEVAVGLWPGRAGRVVLDVDDKNGKPGTDVLAALEAEHGALPDHPIVLTASGGTHRWFRKPDGVYVGNDDLADGINIRADDGWVVAPGVTTSWGSWEIEEATLGPAPMWPDWIATRLGRPVATNGNGTAPTKPGKWQRLDRDKLDPADRGALEALEQLGGHSAYESSGTVMVVRPGKTAGGSASIGYSGPGLVKIFTDAWPPLEQGAVHDADQLREAAAGNTDRLKNLRANEDVTTIGHGQPSKPAGPVVKMLSDVTRERVHWLWAGRIPLGKLTIIEGDPELAKSTVTLDLAARLSTHRPMPDGHRLDQPGGALLVCAEDDVADTIVPRLLAHHADLTRIGTLTLQRDENGVLIPLSLPEDLNRLEEAIQQVDAKLVIIDPITAYLSEKINSHVDASLRRALAPLSDVAQRNGCAVVLVRHLNKASGDKAMYRGGGSIAFSGAARSVMVVGRHPDNDDVIVLARVKNNLSQSIPSIGYRIKSSLEYESPVIDWSPDPISLDADTLLRGKDGRLEAPQRDLAEEVILDALRTGPRPAPEVKRLALEAGVSKATLDRAKERLAIKSVRKRDGDGRTVGWEWHLGGTVIIEGDEQTQNNVEVLADGDEQPPLPETPDDACPAAPGSEAG